MDTIGRVAALMQTVLGTDAENAAADSGFVRRRSKLTGALFVQTLVFGWLSNPDATLEELSQTAAARGVRISPQGLDQRFTQAAADTVRRTLEAAARRLVSGNPAAVPLLERFQGVYVLDSSTLSLPPELRGVWSGCGGSTPSSGAAALKFQVMLDLKAGLMHGPELSPGRVHDKSSALQAQSLPAGSLRIADLGYFSLDRLAGMSEDGTYWLTKPSVQAIYFVDGGKRRLSLPDLLTEQGCGEFDIEVQAGVRTRVGCRLAGVRAPREVAAERRRKMRAQARREGETVSRRRLTVADWTLVLTNAAPDLLSLQDALALYRARWQIEMLFRLWKSRGRIGVWRSRKPGRILCEVYAKLLAMLVQHWALVAGCWAYPGRSLERASATLRRFAMSLASNFARTRRLAGVLGAVRDCMASGCRIGKRRKSPATWQILLKPGPETAYGAGSMA